MNKCLVYSIIILAGIVNSTGAMGGLTTIIDVENRAYNPIAIYEINDPQASKNLQDAAISGELLDILAQEGQAVKKQLPGRTLGKVQKDLFYDINYILIPQAPRSIFVVSGNKVYSPFLSKQGTLTVDRLNAKGGYDIVDSKKINLNQNHDFRFVIDVSSARFDNK